MSQEPPLKVGFEGDLRQREPVGGRSLGWAAWLPVLVF